MFSAYRPVTCSLTPDSGPVRTTAGCGPRCSGTRRCPASVIPSLAKETSLVCIPPLPRPGPPQPWPAGLPTGSLALHIDRLCPILPVTGTERYRSGISLTGQATRQSGGASPLLAARPAIPASSPASVSTTTRVAVPGDGDGGRQPVQRTPAVQVRVDPVGRLPF